MKNFVLGKLWGKVEILSSSLSKFGRIAMSVGNRNFLIVFFFYPRRRSCGRQFSASLQRAIWRSAVVFVVVVVRSAGLSVVIVVVLGIGIVVVLVVVVIASEVVGWYL